ncbi:Card1-like endonuclease domain-containing protein [Pasteurella sp. PK-2025]|uniref:Card1-like endonuclease domain-containing protein n=1 Tax=Pasteurella sp. PK-2025 TaxID=3413133 RepID=UPI003C72FBB7
MQKYDIHVCLISGQAAPNLLPILDSQFKPKKAIFLVSASMKDNAQYLANTFEKKGVKVDQMTLEDVFDFYMMENQLIDLIAQYEDESIALNVTGGTKLMAIAAQQAFSIAGKPIFYLDTENNRLIFIKTDNNETVPSQQIQAKNDLETYLSSYGFKLIQKHHKTNQDLAYLSKNFITYYQDYKNDIPLLNKYASLSEKSGFKVKIEKEDARSSSFLDLLKDMSEDHVIHYDEDTKLIDFKNKKTKEFLNGIWLEEYTYEAIKDIKTIDDIAFSVNVGYHKYQLTKSEYSQENKGNKNEFDVAFIAKNKLHIIECKTQILEKNNGVKAEDILYKLETLKDYGGLLTKKCLVSYHKIPDGVHNRARELRIEIIQGQDLQRLKTKIQEWIGKKQ